MSRRIVPLLFALAASFVSAIASAQEAGPAENAADDVVIERGIAYLPEGRTEKADLYLPKGRGPAVRSPAVVIIHGGGWRGGQRDAVRELNIGTTLARHGYVGLSIDYLLSTKEKPSWPQNIHDCKTAVRWLRANADRLQIEADHIGAIGGSAGGHLTALLAASGNVPELNPAGPYAQYSCAIQAAVPMYGVAEIGDSEYAAQMLGKTRTEAPELYRFASPATHVDARDPPFLILHGTADAAVPVEQSEILARTLKQAGVEHELIVIEGAPHSFHLQPKERDLRPAVLGFFDKHLKPKR
jgi:acetyl esterase/lipase